MSDAALTDADGRFAEFWMAYPKREAKVAAERTFRRLSKTDQRNAIDGIARWLQSGRWDDRQYVPQPATYLNKRRWEDEITPAAPTGEVRLLRSHREPPPQRPFPGIEVGER